MQKHDANMQETHLQPPAVRLDTPPPQSIPPINRVGTFANDTETVKLTDLNGAFTGLRCPRDLLVYFCRWEGYAEKFHELDSNIDIRNTRIKKDAEMWDAWEKGEGHPKMTPTEKAALQGWKDKIDDKKAIALSEIWDMARDNVAFDPDLWSIGYKTDGRKLVKVSKEEKEAFDKGVEAEAEEWEELKVARERKRGANEMDKAEGEGQGNEMREGEKRARKVLTAAQGAAMFKEGRVDDGAAGEGESSSE